MQPVLCNLPVGGILLPVSFLMDDSDRVGELMLDIKFSNKWEMMGNWNEDSNKVVMENVLYSFRVGAGVRHLRDLVKWDAC